MLTKRQLKPRTLLLVLCAVIIVYLVYSLGGHPAAPPHHQISLSQATADLQGKTPGVEITAATINEQQQVLTLTEKGTSTQLITKFPLAYTSTLTTELLKANIKVTTDVTPAPSWLITLVELVAPAALVVGALFVLLRRGLVGRFGTGRGVAAEVPTTRFKDVAGASSTVDELAEVVEFLHAPEHFVTAGARLPKGILLVGPPGTGKTLLARAVAGEAGVPFFPLSGSDFVEAYAGVGAARVRQVFDKAKAAGRAIIFIDEIDAVGRARSNGPMHAAVQEHENTLIQLLNEMDGFTEHGIIILGATNRADVLDPALTRPGRFDRVIPVPAPDRKSREEILRLYTQKLTLSGDVDLASLARRTPGMTGADISQVTNEAALEAARRGQSTVTARDFESALTTTVVGREQKSAAMTPHDQKVVAYHEAGHAVVAILHPDVDNPVSVSIIPRGATGGHTWMGGSDDSLTTRTKSLAQLVAMMGGRAGEQQLLDGDFTQGSSGDLKSATHVATEMVSSFGMGERGIAYRDPDSLVFGESQTDVVAEVNTMLSTALQQAQKLLSDNSKFHHDVAEALIQRESLTYDEMIQLMTQDSRPVGHPDNVPPAGEPTAGEHGQATRADTTE